MDGFEFECELVFVARDWTTCYVEMTEHATMLFCSPEQSNLLIKYLVGTKLMVRGRSNLDSGFVHVDQIKIVESPGGNPLELDFFLAKT